MFKKLSSGRLLIIFLLLLGLVVILKICDSMKGERTFRSDFFALDTVRITSVEFYPLSDQSKKILLQKTGDNWTLVSNEKNYRPDPYSVNNILMVLSALKPERVAATDAEKWNEFQVDDSTGIQLMVKQGNELVADLIIGKFSFQQNSRKTTSYVRLKNDENVYAVDGLLRLNFDPDINNYRDRTLCKFNPASANSLTFQYQGDSSFVVIKKDTHWMIGESVADSNEVSTLINTLSSLNSSDFINEPVQLLTAPSHSVTIVGNSMTIIEIKAFPADSINQYYITTSANEDAVFSGARSGLFEKIFVPASKFLAKD